MKKIYNAKKQRTKEILREVFYGIILIGMVTGIVMFVSCESPKGGNGTKTNEPCGEVTLYKTNGKDTTIIVTRVKVYNSTEMLIYYDTNNVRNVTTLDFHYTRYE